ncbi:hypothetical protein BDB01DRAFT_777739 [Pilobolus umbonatus]|nr:hypothetical protein BDB01DRAFT_786269 [Pilobolus umbonatus]KAI8992257.1 hypothetical protein BDB01DRAFT_777739 [Pilobolus umbonatus]
MLSTVHKLRHAGLYSLTLSACCLLFALCMIDLISILDECSIRLPNCLSSPLFTPYFPLYLLCSVDIDTSPF